MCYKITVISQIVTDINITTSEYSLEIDPAYIVILLKER